MTTRAGRHSDQAPQPARVAITEPAVPAAPTARTPTTAVQGDYPDAFECTLEHWDPYGGAWSFGNAEMDAWALTLLHDTHAAHLRGWPCWVLRAAGDTQVDPDGPIVARADRYRGGHLEESEVLGLLVAHEGELRLSDEVFDDWSASSESGFSDLPAGVGDTWPAAG